MVCVNRPFLPRPKKRSIKNGWIYRQPSVLRNVILLDRVRKASQHFPKAQISLAAMKHASSRNTLWQKRDCRLRLRSRWELRSSGLMGPIGCPETSISSYHYSLCNKQKNTVLILWQRLYLFYFLKLCSPARAMASSFTRFRNHTQRRATVGRTPLDEWSARRKDLYL
jgi:hypothetical protein